MEKESAKGWSRPKIIDKITGLLPAGRARRSSGNGEKLDDEQEVAVFPHLVYKELLCMIAIVAGLLIWSMASNAPLREIANLTMTENPAKAPWYFVGLQELLVYFDPWIAGVMLPTIIVLGLMLVPYLDSNPEGSGYYSYAGRKFASFNFIFGFAMWWVLIIIGQMLRGPGWQIYMPWESWVVHKPVPDTKLWSFGLALGPIALMIYFGLGLLIPALIKREFFAGRGLIKYTIVMLLTLAMYGVPVKVFLRLAFNVRYVLMTPWFNI